MSDREYALKTHLGNREPINEKKRRSRIQIMAEILEFCRRPKKKTRVMYGTNLSWEMLERYVSRLQSMKLLKTHDSQTSFTTTQEGLRFVQKWRDLAELSCRAKETIKTKETGDPCQKGTTRLF